MKNKKMTVAVLLVVAMLLISTTAALARPTLGGVQK